MWDRIQQLPTAITQHSDLSQLQHFQAGVTMGVVPANHEVRLQAIATFPAEHLQAP